MRLLLDTHIYAWWAGADRRLSRAALHAIEGAGVELLLSAVVPWEIATKFRIGKWAGGGAILANLGEAIEAKRLTPLPITLVHAAEAGLLPWAHRDPFDRLLAAQAALENAVLVSADPVFAGAGIEILR